MFKTHLTLVPHISVSDGTYSAPSHYLNQCWVIVNWIHRNKFQGNWIKMQNCFLHENAFENIAWDIAAMLSKGEELKLDEDSISLMRSRRVIPNTNLHANPTPKVHSSRICKYCKWFKCCSVYTVTIRNVFACICVNWTRKELRNLYSELKI